MPNFENVIQVSSMFLHLFCNEERGGLWMVRYSLYQGGRMLIFASD